MAIQSLLLVGMWKGMFAASVLWVYCRSGPPTPLQIPQSHAQQLLGPCTQGPGVDVRRSSALILYGP